jgi:hypothetical protein
LLLSTGVADASRFRTAEPHSEQNQNLKSRAKKRAV